jgi:hypothetical protein
MADVEFQVEIIVLHPVGLVEVQRHHGQLALEHRGAVQAAGKRAKDVLEPHHVSTGSGGVINQQRRDVHRRIVHFCVEKSGVQPTQLMHAFTPPNKSRAPIDTPVLAV